MARLLKRKKPRFSRIWRSLGQKRRGRENHPASAYGLTPSRWLHTLPAERRLARFRLQQRRKKHPDYPLVSPIAPHFSFISYLLLRRAIVVSSISNRRDVPVSAPEAKPTAAEQRRQLPQSLQVPQAQQQAALTQKALPPAKLPKAVPWPPSRPSMPTKHCSPRARLRRRRPARSPSKIFQSWLNSIYIGMAQVSA